MKSIFMLSYNKGKKKSKNIFKIFGIFFSILLAVMVFLGVGISFQNKQRATQDLRASAAEAEAEDAKFTATTYEEMEKLLNGSVKNKHFSWTGVPQRQFSDQEIEKIATQVSIAIIPKFHAKWNYELHHADAIRLKKKNQNLKVLVYQSARFVFPRAIDYERSLGFKDEWLFLDKDGQPISLSEDKEQILYLDVANPEYRAWVIQKLKSYLAVKSEDGVTAYDGIALDSSRFIADGNTPARKAAYTKTWLSMLSNDPTIGQQRIDTWNQGMRLLLQEIETAFPDKVILYNGFAEKAVSANRNLELFQYVDTGLNEDFCIAGPIDTREYLTSDQVQSDLDLMKQYTKQNSGKTLLQKVNFGNARNSDEFGRTDIEMGRYCYGMYMLGAYANRSYFKLGDFYGAGEADQFVVESKIRLGAQKSDYVRTGNLFQREFENAYIYVNTGSTDVTLYAPTNVVLVNGAVLGKKFATGETITIPQHDAYFLLKDTTIPNVNPKILVSDSSVVGNLITNDYLPDSRCENGNWCKWYRNNQTATRVNSTGSLSISNPGGSSEYGACWIQWVKNAQADGSTYRIRAKASSSYPQDVAFIQLQTYGKESYVPQPWWYINGTTDLDKTIVIKDKIPSWVAIKFCTWGSSTSNAGEATLEKLSFEKVN